MSSIGIEGYVSGDDFNNGKSKPERSINSYARIVLMASILGGFIFGLDIGANGATTTDGFRDAMGFPRKLPGKEDSIETTNRIAMFAVVFHIFTLIGALPSGMIADKYGRKPVILAAMILLLIGDVWQGLSGVVSPSGAWANCLVGRAFAGLGIGFTLTVMPVYAAELSPASYRGKVVTCFQLAITIGILVVSVINQAIQNDHWGWRLSICIQIAPILVVLYLCIAILPESPKYLIKVDKVDEARVALNKLSLGEERQEEIVKNEVNAIEAEVQEEKSAGTASLKDLFYGTLWPAFLCGFMVAFSQNITGVNYLMNWGTTLFSTLNLNAFLFDTILKIINVLATVIALFVIDRLGRKTLLVWGTILVVAIFGTLSIVVFATGVELESTSDDSVTRSVQYFVVACCFMFQVVFAITWGPIGWVVPSEVFELRARGIGMGMAVFGNMLTNITMGDYGFKAIQSALGLDVTILTLCLLNLFMVVPVVVFLLPETKNVTLEDMHYIFAYERGGNAELGHGTMHEFCMRSAKQTLDVLRCRSVDSLKGVPADLLRKEANKHDLEGAPNEAAITST